jgi:hypothetical protein
MTAGYVGAVAATDQPQTSHLDRIRPLVSTASVDQGRTEIAADNAQEDSTGNIVVTTKDVGSTPQDVLVHYVSNTGRRRTKLITEDEPLVDNTITLAKKSKKTARMQKRQQKKEARKVHSAIQSLLDFPQELLSMILSFLQPSDVFTLLRVSHPMRSFILDNERSLSEEIMRQRYWVLKQCFHVPLSIDQVPDDARPALLSEPWQSRLKIHRNPYQHIRHINQRTTCTCMSCVLAWNNLNIILDLSHWQHNLENREPLPIIPRGRNPEWNEMLLDKHADVVVRAMSSPLTYARILQKHLDSTTRTIIRFGKWRKKGEKATTIKPRLYHLTDAEAASATDAYLERSGPPNYQPIYMRDQYYSVEAFIPNRKWDKQKQKWLYYAAWPTSHLNDLNWIAARFTPKEGWPGRMPSQREGPMPCSDNNAADTRHTKVIEASVANEAEKFDPAGDKQKVDASKPGVATTG